MPQWTEDKPLRVATGFTYVSKAIHFIDSVISIFWTSDRILLVRFCILV